MVEGFWVCVGGCVCGCGVCGGVGCVGNVYGRGCRCMVGDVGGMVRVLGVCGGVRCGRLGCEGVCGGVRCVWEMRV